MRGLAAAKRGLVMPEAVVSLKISLPCESEEAEINKDMKMRYKKNNTAILEFITELLSAF